MTDYNHDEGSRAAISSAPVGSWQWLGRIIFERFGANKKYSGVDGFEGFIAKLLGALTGESFYVAPSGYQPMGDAVSRSLRTTIQAKLYKESSLKEKELIGDIVLSARENRELEIYILAATKPNDVRLHESLTATAAKQGVDFIYLELSQNGPSDLGGLALEFWEEVTAGFVGPQPKAANWVATQLELPEIRRTIDKIRREIKESISTRNTMASQSAALLKRRLFPSQMLLLGTTVNRSEYVERPCLSEAMDGWWKNPIGLTRINGVSVAAFRI